jgi:hypothetical protein
MHWHMQKRPGKPIGWAHTKIYRRRKGDFIPTKIRFRPFSVEDDDYVPASGPYFSCDPEALRKEATNRQRNEATEAAEDLRRQAKFFQHLRGNKEEKRLWRWSNEINEWEHFQVIAWLAIEDDEIFESLFEQAMKYCSFLSKLATTGRPEAANRLALIAIQATRVIGEIAKSNPNALCALAQEQIAWPFLKSQNRLFSANHQKLLKDLKVGGKCGGSISKTSLFVPANRFGKISAKLWKYIYDTRERMRFFQENRPEYLESIERLHPKALTIDQEAAKLPEPNEDMAGKKWCDVGKRILTESYPHPRFPGELNENVPALRNLITAASHQRSRNAIINRIYTELERNFDIFAGQCRKTDPNPGSAQTI